MRKMSFSIAIFPYLKTSARLHLGKFEFRSTEDVEDLPPEQREAVREVADMLFLKDDLRVTSATFAIVPPIDIDRQGTEVDRLADIRAVVAYAYSSPHEVFDDILLSPEEVSLVLLTPGAVSTFLVYPEHHTVPLEGSLGRRVPTDERKMVRGYSGLYNFTQPLWVAPGSRLYPPKPQATLNIRQDMAADFTGRRHGRSGVGDLLRLLNSPAHPARARAFTALRWYNHANESSAGTDRALLNLAVAFEALFNLPGNAKSERLADSISLLLGRTGRIQDWATQFYAARSRIAHEGAAGELYYRPAARQKSSSDERFGSLMLSGRTIFQLCMSTLLFGMALSEEAHLGEKLVSNSERFARLCSVLSECADDPARALATIDPIVREIERHRFVQSTPVDFDLMLGALCRAAAALLSFAPLQSGGLEEALRLCAVPKEGRDLLPRLDAVRQLVESFEASEATALSDHERVLHILSQEVWRITFMTYFALKRESEKG
jgi:hypothetical protein